MVSHLLASRAFEWSRFSPSSSLGETKQEISTCLHLILRLILHLHLHVHEQFFRFSADLLRLSFF